VGISHIGHPLGYDGIRNGKEGMEKMKQGKGRSRWISPPISEAEATD